LHNQNDQQAPARTGSFLNVTKGQKMTGQEKQLFAPGEDWQDHQGTERSNHDPAHEAAAALGGSVATEGTVEIDHLEEWHNNEYAFGD
jgi:hypothetical protein